MLFQLNKRFRLLITAYVELQLAHLEFKAAQNQLPQAQIPWADAHSDTQP